MMSYRADKVKFTDGERDRQTDAGKDNTPSAWKTKRQKYKYILMLPEINSAA